MGCFANPKHAIIIGKQAVQRQAETILHLAAILPVRFRSFAYGLSHPSASRSFAHQLIVGTACCFSHSHIRWPLRLGGSHRIRLGRLRAAMDSQERVKQILATATPEKNTAARFQSGHNDCGMSKHLGSAETNSDPDVLVSFTSNNLASL
jgi:hypothetical protein